MNKDQNSPIKLGVPEQRCLQALADGMSQKQAAINLGLHVRTFEEHIRNARQRSGAKTTYQLLAIAVHCSAVSVMWNPTIEDDI